MSATPESKHTILVVDDSKSIQTLFRIYLRRLPVRPIFASDGVEALELVAQELPDLILLDLMMPRMDGLTFLDRLNEIEGAGEIPRIIISARRDTHSLQQSLGRGISAYLVKPISIHRLLPLIEEALETGSFQTDPNACD